MSWACDFAEAAQKDLKALPRIIQKRVARALEQMSTDPFHGDVKALKGKEWNGVFRRRIGSYRILFKVDHNKQKILIARIIIRSEKTYI